MRLFPDALSTVRTAVTSGADLDTLKTCALAMASCCPASSGDLIAVVNGLVALLDFYEEPYDHEVLAAQVLGELESIEFLVGGDASDPEWDTDGGAEPEDPLFGPDDLVEFRESQHDRLEQIEEELASPDMDLDRIRRWVHTLKGDAGTVGAVQLEAAYHEAEDRLGEELPVDDVRTLLTVVCDWARQASTAASEGQPPESASPEWPARHVKPSERADDHDEGPAQVVERGAIVLNQRVDDETLALFSDFYAESMESLTAADDLLVQCEHGDTSSDGVDCLFRTFHTIKGLAGFLEFRCIAELAHATEARLDHARKDLDAFTPDTVDLMLRSTEMMKEMMEGRRELFEGGNPFHPPRQLDTLIGQLGGSAAPVQETLRAELDSTHTAPEPAPPATEASVAPATPEAPEVQEVQEVQEDPAPQPRAQDTPTTRSAPRLSVVKETIKVDLARVDKLVETIGELVIMEAMVTQSVNGGGSPQTAQYQMSQLSKVVRDLQRQGLALRMVPLRGVFGKMSRLVRDLSRKSSKEVQLILMGQDAEMDRSLAERLGDPLVHMVRNAVDHGIESPDDRERAGKPRQGTLTLSAYHEGGNIVIELSDDGKGLDREGILKKAVERQLVTDPSSMSDKEVWDLIFHPGFSTAAKVTEISGRGVGMDVVKKTIEGLRGRIHIDSEPGHGTTFRFLLPLTLAIIDGMLVACGSERYVLPTLTIEESIQPTADQFHRFGAAGAMLDVRGQTLPLVNLAETLNIDAPCRHDPMNALVMLVDGVNGRFGLVVDDVIGQQQVVIKHLSETINNHELFSGAAILSDGQVGLILNTTGLGPTRTTGRGVSHAC